MRIQILSGSSRPDSTTRRVAVFLQRHIGEVSGHETGLIDLRDVDLTPVEQVILSVDHAPEQHRELAEKMFSAQAFILVTPEYNGSYSAALKNLQDHFPKQHRKVFGLVTASPGGFGGIRAALQLQELVFALFGIGSPYMLIEPGVEKKFDSAGHLIDPAFQKQVDVFVKEFLWLAERVTS